MADDPLSSALERIEERAKVPFDWRTGPNPNLAMALGRDASILLAALRAVLELAGELEHLRTVPPSGEEDEAAVLGLRWCATRVREAITREITGKGENDEPR